MASVSLDKIKKVYDGGVEAVKNASFEVKDGEFVVLVGPSGCGKSTTLRMIAGLESISGGELRIGERVVNDVAPKDRNIAMVFQNYALYPHMSVFDNMAFGLKLRKYPKAEIRSRVQEAAETLGLTDLLDRRPKHLSGGQRQRVAVGRAIVRKPEVFLFDEPLSNLDAKLRGEMRSEISRLHRDLETTMIYVTHDQVEAMTMGDRIVILKDGDIQQIDSPMEIYKRPANVFVAGFIGSPPMNIMKAGLSKEGDHASLQLAKNLSIQISGEALKDYTASEVVIGVRPEDLHIGKSFENAVRFGSGSIENVEPLGGQIDYQASFDFGKMRSRLSEVDPRTKTGSSEEFSCELDKVHFFSVEGDQARIN